MPQAKTIIDKFHVIKMANEAMEKTRKGIRSDLDEKQRCGLTHYRFVLLKRKSNLTDKEALNLDGWTKNDPLLGEPYQLQERFDAVYEDSPEKGSLDPLRGLEQECAPEFRQHFSNLIRAFTSWQLWVLNYCE